MLNKAKVSNYKSIINFEHSKRGDFDNLYYNPTFKSSAIFFVLVDKYINTKISFLNYWKIKNHNKDISCQITIRKNDGDKILRKFFKVKLNTYMISLKDLLNENLKITKFTGSIEVELFSSLDLKYSFPAIDAIYETKQGISLVHSNQRVFDSMQDNLQNKSINQIQTGFDIYLDNKLETFIAAINGPLALNNQKMKIDFFNYNGQKFTTSNFFKSIKAYEIINFNLKSFKKLKNFLSGKRGYCKIDLPTKNIFNRVIVGTLNNNKTKITTTHSYYDCSQTKDYINLKKISAAEYGCYLPFNLFKKIKLDVVIYPIFSKANLNFSLEKIDKNNEKKIINSNVLRVSKNFKQPHIIEINKYLKNEKKLSENIYFLNITSKDNLIPARLTFGFNYKTNSIGSNISDSMIVNHGKDFKSKGFYWGPAFISKKINTIITISSFNKNKKRAQSKNKISLKIYGKNSIILKKVFNINCPAAFNIYVNKIINSKIKKIHNDEIVWFTISSNHKNLVCKHVHISTFGHVAADHVF